MYPNLSLIFLIWVIKNNISVNIFMNTFLSRLLTISLGKFPRRGIKMSKVTNVLMVLNTYSKKYVQIYTFVISAHSYLYVTLGDIASTSADI